MTAAVPDPRFRDLLAEAMNEEQARYYGAGYVAGLAEVEARVQAAANQRAVEALRELLAVLDRITVGRKPQKLEDAMAAARAALASPAPAPRAEEGRR